MVDKLPMNGQPLDEESFARLLAAAYVVQEHQDRASAKAALPPSDFAQIISRIVDTQHLIQTRSLDAQAALDLIAGQMQRLSGAGGAAIGLVLDHVLHYKAAIGSASILLGREIPEDVSISAKCLKKGEKLVSPLCEADPQIDQAFRRRVKAQSLIAVPIYHEGKIAGNRHEIGSLERRAGGRLDARYRNGAEDDLEGDERTFHVHGGEHARVDLTKHRELVLGTHLDGPRAAWMKPRRGRRNDLSG